ncbi:autotransporter outer membrane beta-barrel domain-containing protein [Mesorhizobium loti]|uniref:autotransporter outer membrane beta-barrel domain-containing protein n=1 Tax=Rhizobium loti TaxID=381 RepID=UPI0007EF97E4|nr:autotransporter outer membrane beta-barrel domain-containing protein [Mesorhizobium loti]OBP96820.1 autotransporter outer membrane beta-barrel domain-containing protein [Mesorhizobium loti]
MPQHGFGSRKAKALKYLALTSTALVCLGQPITASADAIWTGAASTDWFTAGNWKNSAVPTSGDDVLLNPKFPNPTVIDGGNGAAHYLFLGTIASYTGSLTIKSGGTLASTAGFVGYLADANGVVTVTGAGSAWNNSSDLFLAASPSSTGTLTISNGGAVSDTVGHVGSGGTGIATVDGIGSTWTNSGDLYIAEHGTGTLAITKGGAVSNAVGTIGWHAGSNGTVTVDGAGSTWTNSSNLFVGDQGTGALTVSGGGAVSNLSGILGNLAGSTGTATVDGVGSTWHNAALAVGNAGFGVLTISNGGVVTSSVGYAAYAAGSTGAVVVDGPGSAWKNSSNLFIGDQGTGALTVTGGGAVSNALGYVGDFAGSSGMVFVDGAGSTWSNTSNLFVGNLGTGNLAITHGGAVSNDAGLVGVAVGASGSATVDGIGSVWTNNSSLTVGEDGTGTLAISNGGKVTSTAGYLSFDAGSVGTVTVSGAGSTWTNSDLLIVGQRGTGLLIVSNGGKVANTNGFVGGSAGSIGMASISGANSTWANSGDLYVGGFGPGTLTIANGGTVSAGGVVNIAGFAGTIGTLNIGAASGSSATAAGALNAASIQLGPGAGTINFNHTDTNYIFASAISGAGTINQIAGNTNLTADSSGFTGATNVSGGRLAVNGSLAGSLVTISGGTLGGNGTVGGIVAQSGGIIAPGNSIGTLNVAGDIDQAAGSIYQVELTTTGQSDLLHATGKATIAAGAILDVVKTDAAPYVPGAHFTVLQADAGVTGTYSVSGVGPFTGLFANYDATHVYLDVVQAKSFAEVGLTPNQMATGGGAESLGAGNPLFDAIMGLSSEAAAQNAFDQLSGEIHASAKGMLLEDSSFIRDAASNRISAAFGDASAAALPVMAYGEGGPEMVAADTDRFAVWGQAFGSWGNVDCDGNAAAFDRSTGGLLAGADTLLGDWRVGLLGGYSHSSFNADDRNSSGKSDNYHLGLYGGTNWGAIAFRTGAAYSWSSLSTHRSVAFNGFTDGLSADYDAGTAQMFGELAYKAETSGSFKFEPFANLAYVSVHTDGFSETGGAAALTSAGTSTNATFTTLGLRGSTDFALGGVNATARGMLGWRHAFGDVTPTSSFAFAGGNAFTIAGVPISGDAAVVEAGIDMKMSPNATLGLSYSGQFGGGAVDNGAKANLSVKF